MRNVTLDVGVDLDGVCYDFTSTLRNYIARSGHKRYSEMPESNCWYFYREQWGMTDSEFVQHCRDAVRAGDLFWRGYILPDTQWALHKLMDDGHRVHLVTDRQYLGGSQARTATRYWLDANNLPYTSLTVSKDKNSVRTDIFIDDRPKNYEEIKAAGGYPVYMTRPWNRDEPGRRVASWSEFITMVEHTANTYEENL